MATRPGTTGCKRQRAVRSWRDFKATSGNGSGGDGPEFGSGWRNAGKGEAFAHSVAEEFPQFFKLPEERLCGNDEPGYWRPSPRRDRLAPRPHLIKSVLSSSAHPDGSSPSSHSTRRNVSRLRDADLEALRLSFFPAMAIAATFSPRLCRQRPRCSSFCSVMHISP